MILSSLRKFPFLQLGLAEAGATVAGHLFLAFETLRILGALGPRLVHCNSFASQNQLQINLNMVRCKYNMVTQIPDWFFSLKCNIEYLNFGGQVVM